MRSTATRSALAAALAALLLLPAAARAAVPAPDSARVLKSIRALASDEFQGRRTGEPGCDAAARWLADRFAELKLEPLGDSLSPGKRSFLQTFETTVGVRAGGPNRLSTATPGGDRAWRPDSDFAPLGFSENDDFEGVPVVFVGYGVTADDKGYDDYTGVDVKDKVVVLLRFVPADEDSTGPFGPAARSRYAELRYKASNAFNHGARAALVVRGPRSHRDTPDAPLPLRSDQGVGGGHIPVLSVRSEVAEALLEAAAAGDSSLRPDSSGSRLGALQARLDATRKGRGVALAGVSVSLRTRLVHDRRKVANVVARLAGSAGSEGETVVIGGHYDHLGWGGAGSLEPDVKAIHFGADDNASGTAGVLELARCFAAGERPRRNLLFVCFTGEEEGLYGSGYYVNHPPVPVERTAAMINMDMIGRLKDDKVYVGGAGTSPLFPPLLARAARTQGLASSPQASGYGPSDHTSFYAKDRPVLFFFTGAHSDYHKPADTWDKINAPGEARVLAMVEEVVGELAGRDSAIAFTKVLADSAGGGGGGEGYGGSGYGPYLGTVPDFGENPDIKGVLLSGVREGSPAEKAGIKGKDVLTRFDGKVLGNLQDYAYALAAKKPGDVVQIEMLRDGKPMTLTVTLGRRGKK
jgi:hypothetical protein